MLGPVSGTRNSPPDAGTLVFMQLIGIWFVYGALLGWQRPSNGVRKEPEIAIRVLFGCVGSYCIWFSSDELYHSVGYPLPIASLLLVTLCLFAVEFVSRRKYRGWRQWPRVEASVESTDVREIRARHSHYFVAELAYSYVVSGNYYSGRFSRDFQDEGAAWEYVKHMRGANAMVHYHPQQPERNKADAFL